MERIDLLYAARSDELKVRKGLRGIYSVYCTLNVTQSGTVYQVNAALKTGYWNRSLWYLKTTCSSEQAAAAKFQWILGNLPLAIAEGSGNSKFYSFLNCRADDECVHKALEEWGRLLAAEKFLTWPLIDTTHGEQELAQGLVTMGVGRHLVTLLESGQALSPESAAGLARYFSQAPLKVGYWGPYKRLIKLLETRPSDAQWLGIALGRLDSHDTRWSESDVDLKNYDVGIPDTVPSEETIIYMVRRGRRHLRRLSRTQPEEYVRCALGIFHHPSDVELDHRWILADILYARGTKDFHCGRWRALQLPAPPARYNRRWDRAPEIWDQHLDQVRRLWVENSDQTDIQVWAFWVLNDHPQPLPELPAKPLALALLSPSSQLQLFACQQISVHPAILLELPEPAVRAFLSTCTEGQLDTVLPFLVAHSGCLTIQEALLAYVRQVALPNISPNAISLSPAFRATRLLSFALRYLLPNLHANELAPLAHCLGHLTGYEPVEQWRWVFQILPLATLVSLRLHLPGLSAGVGHALDDACRRAAYTNPPPVTLVMDLILAQHPALRALGWDLLPYALPTADRGQVWEQLLARATEGTSQELLLEALSHPERFNYLLDLPLAPAVLGGIVAAIADAEPTVSRRILDKLLVSGDTPVLLEALEAYLTARRDPAEMEGRTLLNQAVALDPAVPALIWAAQGRDAWPFLLRILLIDPALTTALVQAIDPEELLRATSHQIALLAQALLIAPERLRDDPGFAVAAGTCPDPQLHQPVLAWLEAQVRLGPLFLPLAESGLPAALTAAEHYLFTLHGPDLTRALIQICDSGVGPARALGLRVLTAHAAACDLAAVLNALSEHTAPEITALVARHALAGAPLHRDALARFDDRVLRTRHGGRTAKNLVKARLDQTLAPDSDKVAALVPPDEQRLATLLGLARGGNHRDREWALQQLARLALAGHGIASLQVSITS